MATGGYCSLTVAAFYAPAVTSRKTSCIRTSVAYRNIIRIAVYNFSSVVSDESTYIFI